MVRTATARSAGLPVYRLRGSRRPEFLLTHPGGPYWARRDLGAWSVPKGLIGSDEEPVTAAQREFREKTGLHADGDPVALTPVRLGSGKLVYCWLAEGDLDLSGFRSNSFKMEWPPRSGRMLSVPECDQAAYFDVTAAREKILTYQRPLIDEAAVRLAQGER